MQVSKPLPVAAIACGGHCLWWPLPVAAIAYGGHCLWRPLPVAAIACGGHCLWRPLPVAAIACGGHCLWRPLPVAAIGCTHISKLRAMNMEWWYMYLEIKQWHTIYKGAGWTICDHLLSRSIKGQGGPYVTIFCHAL